MKHGPLNLCSREIRVIKLAVIKPCSTDICENKRSVGHIANPHHRHQYVINNSLICNPKCSFHETTTAEVGANKTTSPKVTPNKECIAKVDSIEINILKFKVGQKHSPQIQLLQIIVLSPKCVQFWKRDPRALREADTRLTYKDHPAHAANLAKAKAKLGLKADARQLLLAAVKNQTRKAA